MNNMEEIQSAIERLTPAERASIALWLRHEWGETGHRVAEPEAAYVAAPEPHRLSVEEYLELEEASALKHEYVGGEIFAMSGASLRHNAISGNLFNAISAHLHGKPCRAFIADVKIRLQFDRDEIFYYPDVMVACGRLSMEDKYLRDPKLVIEVLSPSTEAIDRREKALHYRSIASLEEYALVAQRRHEVSVFRRRENWEPRVSTAPQAVADFLSIGFSLPLARVYDGVFRGS
jgi:Uma2 family endonuclease